MERLMIYQKDNYYHVFNRGCNKEKIFLADSDYRNLLTKIKLTKDKYRVEVVAYCLLPNHYHLMLYQKSDKPISDWLRDLFNGYVQRFNRKYDRSGTIFERTAKPKIITSDKYLVDVIHYIHSNPFKHGFVDNSEEWEFSSLSEYLCEENMLVNNKMLKDYFTAEYKYQTSFHEYLERKKYKDELD